MTAMTNSRKKTVESKIEHPAHYGGENNIYEAIKVIEAYDLNFCLGNVIKYILRSGKKPTEPILDDLNKAKWYLDREIARLEQDLDVRVSFHPTYEPT